MFSLIRLVDRGETGYASKYYGETGLAQCFETETGYVDPGPNNGWIIQNQESATAAALALIGLDGLENHQGHTATMIFAPLTSDAWPDEEKREEDVSEATALLVEHFGDRIKIGGVFLG